MNVRESKRPICPYANASKDLLVCLPSRSHLTLMPKGPKPICSPARLLQASKRNHHHRKKLLALRSGGSEQASEIAEPTSPKVTCAGQIKVRPGRPASSGKNWQAVMEEIEKLHERRHTYKGSSPSSPLWFKKDVMQFFACLRGVRFDFRCFGAFPSSATSDDEDEDDGDDEEEEEEDTGTQNTDDGGEAKPEERAMFSKWFMVLEEPQNPEASSAEEERGKASGADCGVVPPRNALLLMRCRSAPPKSWLEEKVGDDVYDDHEEVGDESSSKTMAEMYEGENLVETRYGKKLCTISTDIVKETWVVEGITKDPLSRSRSWKR
ncbi:hypothetical protein DM860_009555 [Cuscuta australis]|uniref:Uncharacterized protein n=1 Tax=Cuscuta australis TaxID=267555 RepID=A0A328DNB8_9ASTE|nr:hypothetical protein DM860_009555 [Cuscuta australis]